MSTLDSVSASPGAWNDPSKARGRHDQPIRSDQALDSSAFGNVAAMLAKGCEDGVFPGAVLSIARNGQLLFRKAVGQKWSSTFPEAAQAAGPMTIETVFDIASLTEVVVTTTLLMKLISENKLALSDRLSRYVHGFGVLGKSPITVGQLLSHTSGLVAWHPFFEDLLKVNAGTRMGILTSRSARDFIVTAINRSELKQQPGTKQLYSDLGFIMLGYLAEVLTGISLDKAAYKGIFQPLGLKSTSFIDLSMIKRRGIHPITDVIAPTEECPWRKRMLCGEVHDDNAWAMGGVAGHSGLFSTANDLQRFLTELLFSAQGRSEFLPADIVKLFWSYRPSGLEGSWRLGWDSPGEENGMNSSGLSPHAVGMCGFTGCSGWIDPIHGLTIVLMTNRVHPSRSNKKIRAFRSDLHRAILHATVGSEPNG